MIKIGINGFGRIGRVVAKVNESQNRFKLVAINDINPHVDNMAYLFKYDSTYDRFEGDVSVEGDNIIINGNKVRYTSERDISNVDWDSVGVDVVIDASGVAHNVESAKKLVQGSNVKKVIVTHSSPKVDNEIIVGVNDDKLKSSDEVISNSICDANAIAHALKWIDEEFGIKTGSVTTVHPWLSYQNLVDGASISQKTPGMVWTDYALGRSSINSLIPKNTTAVTATEKVLPQIAGKLASFSYRVPTDIVSSSDVTIIPEKETTEKELFSFFEKKIAESPYVKGNKESCISLDYKKTTSSGVVDLQWLKYHNGVIKVIMWYDNEWGYCSRALDLVEKALNA